MLRGGAYPMQPRAQRQHAARSSVRSPTTCATRPAAWRWSASSVRPNTPTTTPDLDRINAAGTQEVTTGFAGRFPKVSRPIGKPRMPMV